VRSGHQWSPGRADALTELESRSGGVVSLDSGAGVVRLNLHTAEVSAIVAYNAALPLLRHFDSTAQLITDPAELHTALQRLERAMATAFERISHDRAILIQAAGETGGTLSHDRERVFTELLAITQAGPAGLLDAARDRTHEAACESALAEYDNLSALAAGMPRVGAMREYLLAMGLHDTFDDDSADDTPNARLATDCKLLLVAVAVNAASQAKSPATLDSLEARFQRFKWTYIPRYLEEHERWRK
jgi:hypothetical protein